jgi:CheY-like chemotaxis protein
MNLEFGILWIEDSFNEQEESSLKRRVSEVGFIARIENIPNGDEIEQLGRRQANFHCFDLILLDYKLKNEDGDELAPKIRKLFPSTTILFYSGSEEEDGLRNKIAAKKVEGVYCSHRRRFIERTGELIDQTAKALDRLSGMRGLAMRVVAECDALMKHTVRNLTNHHESCKSEIERLDEDVLKHLDIVKTKYEQAIEVDLEARLGTFAVDTTKLYKHFRRLTKLVTKNSEAFRLSDTQVERLRELQAESANFDTEVIGKRNILGHAREIEESDGWRLEGADGLRVADFPSIRQVFAKYIDAFREIEALVAPRVE